MIDPSAAILFVQIERTGSISGAARAMGITRSTAARRLSALEQSLGVQLVSRTTHTLSLTRAGHAYLPHARDACDALEAAAAAAQNAASAPTGLLRVAAPIINTKGLILPLLQQFRVAYPEIRIEAVFDADVRELVARGFDVGLQTGLEYNQTLTMRRLLKGELRLFASPLYLKERGVPERVEELDDHDCLVHQTSNGEVEPWVTAQGKSFLPEDPVLRTNSLELVLEAAAAGVGICFAPKTIIARDFGDALTPILEDQVRAQEWFSLVYSANKIVPPKVRAFVDFTLAWASANALTHG